MKSRAYISFTSWEDRFFHTYEHDTKNTFNKIILFNYKDGHHIDEKYEGMVKISNPETVNLSIDNNKENWETIKRTIEESGINEALINISTMPRNIIFFLLHFLKVNDINAETIYYNAEKHDTNLTENPQLPQLVLQHSGVFESKNSTILVVLLGYDEERLYQLYNYFEPEKIVIFSEKQHKTTINKELNFNFDGIQSEEYQVNSFEKDNVFNSLEDKVTPLLQTHNIILCSLGPKLSSVEVFKYNNKHQEVALCYVSSAIYSLTYSAGAQLNSKYIRKV